MYQAAISTYILEVQEPVFSGRSIYPCTLVRTVDRAITLCQHCFPFVRAVYVFGTQYYLPTCGYAACRMEDIIISVTFVELWTFASLVCFMTVEYNARRGNGFSCFGIQFADGDHAFQFGAATCISVYHVYFTVLVPEWASVDDTFSRLYQHRLGPRTFRVFGFHHESTLIGVSPEDVKLPVVMTDSGRPYAVTVFGTFGSFNRWQCIGYGSTNDTPVHQIFGVKYLKSGQTVETGRCHVEIISYTAGIRVGIVCIEYRVLVLTVSLVGYPYFGNIVLLLCRQWQGEQQTETH